MTGQGGWPMTVFLTPDGEPFYGGTYFPPEPRHGLPSFRQLLRRGRGGVADAARRHRRAGASARRRRRRTRAGRSRRATRSRRACSPRPSGASRRTFEPAYGGFGRAPKFPPALTLEFLLRRDSPTRRCEMVTKTLDGMARRRHVRPGRRRLPPLLRRRPLARAALREDALRQRAARLGVPARVGRDGRGALSRDRRGDARLRAARAAAARRRPRLRAGRRHERRRRAHVHLDGGRGSPGRAAAAVRARPLDHPRLLDPRASRAAARGARAPAAARPRRQGARLVERARARRAGRGGPSPRARATGSRRQSRWREFVLGPLSGERVGSAARGARAR